MFGMGEFVIPTGLKDIGAIGLVVLAVLLFYTGKIVAGRTVDRLVAAETGRAEDARARADRAEAAAEHWRAAHELAATAVVELSGQVRELTEIGRLTTHMIESVRQVASGGMAGSQTGEGVGGVADG